MIMGLVQRRVQPNPDKVCKALDDPPVGKHQTKDSKPRTSRCKQERWAGTIIADYVVLERKMSGLVQVILDADFIYLTLNPKSNRRQASLYRGVAAAIPEFVLSLQEKGNYRLADLLGQCYQNHAIRVCFIRVYDCAQSGTQDAGKERLKDILANFLTLINC
jgi:hypothetical protein